MPSFPNVYYDTVGYTPRHPSISRHTEEEKDCILSTVWACLCKSGQNSSGCWNFTLRRNLPKIGLCLPAQKWLRTAVTLIFLWVLLPGRPLGKKLWTKSCKQHQVWRRKNVIKVCRMHNILNIDQIHETLSSGHTAGCKQMFQTKWLVCNTFRKVQMIELCKRCSQQIQPFHQYEMVWNGLKRPVWPELYP